MNTCKLYVNIKKKKFESIINVSIFVFFLSLFSGAVSAFPRRFSFRRCVVIFSIILFTVSIFNFINYHSLGNSFKNSPNLSYDNDVFSKGKPLSTGLLDDSNLMVDGARYSHELHINLRVRNLSALADLNMQTNVKEGDVNVEEDWNDEDPFPYKYVINEPNLCSTTTNLYIINLVGVGPWGEHDRNRIRKLWGNTRWYNMTGFKTVFVLGVSSSSEQMERVHLESERHRDIIQFEFKDSYHNLTLKTLCGMHWVRNYCKSPTWVLKSDVDVLINIFELTK